MSQSAATLHMICGKIAAGKSTLATRLGAEPNTIVISEDHFLSRLFADQIKAVPDYVHCAAKLRDAMHPHIVALLRLGISVVLDFPANTIANRQWMRTLFETAPSGHLLHVLDIPNDICLARLHARNAAGRHQFAASDAEFEAITARFAPPGASERFTLIHHPPPS